MPPESTPGPGTPRDTGSPDRRRRTRTGRRPDRTVRRRALRAMAWTAAGIVLLGGTGAGYLYARLNGNLTTVDLDRLLGGHRPQKTDNGSQNILLLGSDSRAGENRKLGGGPGGGSARSDTAMIVHLYKGHRKAAVVSIPRDTLVDRPACTDTQGTVHPAEHRVMFNESYATGGAACAVRTVEALTGVRMDHYLEVDFSGFRRIVDDLGGVRIRTTEAIRDPDSHLDLDAGTHTLDGRQALGLVRTRHGVGDGSDLGRIQLQQAFLRALIDRIGQLGVLDNPTKLYRLADTATRSVTTDSGLGSVDSLISFAGGLKGISSSRTTMITMPVQYAAGNANRVVVDEAKARQVWRALREDLPVPDTATQGTATGEATGLVNGARAR
ncbi:MULTISPECIES: LCP family protein [Streptomyces]|uniref:LCP family protein n=1 Tax=Streptomyces TaxID=1883 RepID=UPI0020410DEB|nr:LCP family protein [Streptomyces thermoviolaceus]MCM3263106.1 LCP family protein [Streptomyces thermoviolaceus]WTD47421.1 LCP family protein [Streptomyces thermoviolaceus]